MAALHAQAAELSEQWQAERQAIAAVHQVQQELAATRTAAARAERTGDLAGAAELEYVQVPELDRRLDAAVKALGDLPPGRPRIKSEVDDEEIAAVVSAWTGVPLKRLMEGEAAKLLQMEDALRRRVVGQDDAVRAVRADPPQPGRPGGRRAADRHVPGRRADRRGQDGDGPGGGRVPVR